MYYDTKFHMIEVNTRQEHGNLKIPFERPYPERYDNETTTHKNLVFFCMLVSEMQYDVKFSSCKS